MTKRQTAKDATIFAVALMNLLDILGVISVPGVLTAAGTCLMTVILVRSYNRDRRSRGDV